MSRRWRWKCLGGKDCKPMKEILALGWLLGFITMFCTITSGYFYLSKITNALKSKHPNVWDSLGRPVPFGNSIQTSLMVRKFVNSPDSYVKDSEISQLAGTLRTIKKIHFCAFAIVILCFVSAIMLKHS
jgi:hypothetical protein